MNMGKEVQLKPKANVSSYVHFLLNYRNKFKEEQPNTYLGFKEFSRKCSEKWRSISKQEKAKYEALAKLDKARYQEEMMNYPGRKKNKKRKRDPHAPRRPPSSFLLFCQDHYAHLKWENPNWSVVQVAKASGEMWSAMTDNEKQPYEQRAALLRAKYQEELGIYRKARKKSLQVSAKNKRRGFKQT
ncbi:high mobility group protein B4 [Physeter macrocephalus]|uniref:High mobility group protein B4 n=1 Tax=Physeter macrocephalus TaxID=9755 RepID=A0A2Y9SX97_PHYMC|nr:high mobility group protein B4 [Physeter catodon]|eukprot:XP_023981160.1 high mobility group protein B4 [Physeter catodon]